MEPTKAPWADPAVASVPSAGSASGDVPPVSNRRGVHTGTPVKPLIEVDPQLPKVLPNGRPSSWEPATKRIKTQRDVHAALTGSTLRDFVAFTLVLSEAVIGVPNSQPCRESEGCKAVITALEQLSTFCNETPTVSHAVRYGNPAFRTWFDKMQSAAPELVYNMLGDDIGEATVELIPYFIDSFGNRSRIDYGTGHETTFLMLLFCLFTLGILKEEDKHAVVTRVFRRYLMLMRQLQTTYWCVRQRPPAWHVHPCSGIRLLTQRS